MSNASGQGSLFLYPGKPDYTPDDFTGLVAALQEAGFISHPLRTFQEDNAFFTGDHYLDYIAYMGCSPSIQFDISGTNIEPGNSFCHVIIHLYDTQRLIVSQKQARAPHCPNCSKPVKNWQDNVSGTQILCEQCHNLAAINDYNWRKMAGYARLFIEVTDIFPREAIPQQLLLDKLKSVSNTDWQYFYSCQ
jgi:uncharacterized protein Usg